MALDRRSFLQASLGATLLAACQNAGQIVLTRIIPAAARAIPHMRINLLRFMR